jgi:phosphoglucosamine mutase
MTNKKYFGTDGVRGRIGSSVMNPEFVMKLGWAFGRTLENSQDKKVLIGKDTRVSGYMLESALEAGLSAAGVDVRLLGPMPTPAIAYLTQTLRASAGIVISASHNLFEDNGIKFFSADGSKLPDNLEMAIESEIDKPMTIVASAKLGKASRIYDAPGRYIEFCKSTIPSLTRLSRLKIVVDCANGATYHIAPKVFAELGAEVISIGAKPDGFNINSECGSTKPEALRKQVIKHNADVGIALDGDGDRVIMIDANGQLITGDQIIYIIAKDRNTRNLLNGGVVGTLMSNFGLEKAIQAMNVPFLRTNVGDRYVLEALRENKWIIGGEPSGHVVCLDKTTTGDGIIAALQVLAIMIKQDKSLHELTDGLTMLPQSLVSFKTKIASKLANDPRVLSAVDDVGAMLRNDGRVILRPSGTEPMLRVMIEGDDDEKIKLYTDDLVSKIKQVEQSLGT